MATVPDRPTTPHGRRAGPSPRTSGAAPSAPRGLFLAAGVGFLLFIAYGSLVPFDFQARPLDAAWQAFQKTPWLVLGVESRADWVANILLYIPLGFCFTAVLGGPGGQFRSTSVAAGMLVFLLGAVVAVCIEFTQLFFPPRTVSLNDLVAELLGTAAGIGLWWTVGARFSRLLGTMTFGGPLALRAAVSAYVLAYVGLSLFPFDFLLNAAELQEKLKLGLYDFFIVRSACGGLLVCGVKLGAEVAAAAPVGVLMGLMLHRRSAGPYATAFAAGCILGAVIEIGQFFIASGVSQGVSILTRGAGFFAGMALQRASSAERIEAARGYLRPLILAAVVPYVGFLLALNGWFSAAWMDGAAALANLHEVRFLPFYYHYYTTESAALQSLLRIAAAYLPVGIGCWLWRYGGDRNTRGGSWIAVVAAALLALVVETGRLFVPEKRPDPTDILIAAFAAWFGYAALAAGARWASGSPRTVQRGSGAPVAPHAGGAQVAVSSRPLSGLWSVLIVVAVLPLALLHPFAVWLIVFLAAYAACLWRYPRAALPAVLALLPILNFAPWTGWVLIEEFDLLVAITIAVWLLRRPASSDARPEPGRFAWPVILLAASYALSALAGLLPFQTLDQSALVTYYGSLNSLRVAKGFVWALLLLPVLREEMRDPGNLERRLAGGVLLGLSGVIAVAIWQRAAMAGLLDFSTDYRIAATFPETHIGGGDLEAYLALAIPFVLAWIALRPGAARLALGTALFALASYVLAVTFARAGYLAYAGMAGIFLVAVVLRLLRQRRLRVTGLALACGVAATGAVIMVPVVTSSFMQSRFAETQTDGAFRARHWIETIDMMSPGAGSALLGMGLGSFPRTYLLKNPAGAVPATFSYLFEGDNRYLRLGSGEPLYLDQRVPVESGQRYTVAMDLRSADPQAGISVSLCEKTEQHSFRCSRQELAVKAAGGKWSRETFAFDSGEVGDAPWLLRRPVVVSLTNPRAGTRVDVDNVSLLDAAGRELVANGDFSRGGARWFFTTDNHAQWHVFNLWVHVYFEQGWLGVLALAAAVAVALARLAGPVWRGDFFSAVLLAALCAALVIGLFNSLLDSPRIATLFFVLLFVALTRPRDGGKSSSAAKFTVPV